MNDLYIREGNPSSPLEIEQIDWLWTKADIGAWDGPKQCWEQHHSKKWFRHVKKFDVAVQAGGCLGMYPRLLSNRFAKVYTFEPIPLAYYCLEQNCPSPNIIKFNAALGSSAGIAEMNVNPNNIGQSSVRTNNENWINNIKPEMNLRQDQIPFIVKQIPVMTIDSLNLSDCDLIALDVEHYEYQVLLGARQTIEKHNPIVVVESGMDENIVNFMLEVGYLSAETSSMDVIWRNEQ